jgi:hypothetical protein
VERAVLSRNKKQLDIIGDSADVILKAMHNDKTSNLIFIYAPSAKMVSESP